MLALGFLLNIAGIGVFCWLIFALAVYALPFFVAINAGTWAFHNGAGLLGTPLVAVAAGGMTLAMAQMAFAVTRSGQRCRYFTHSVSFSTPNRSNLLYSTTEISHLSPELRFSTRSTGPP